MNTLEFHVDSFEADMKANKRKSLKWILGGLITAATGITAGIIAKEPEVAASGVMAGLTISSVGVASLNP